MTVETDSCVYADAIPLHLIHIIFYIVYVLVCVLVCVCVRVCVLGRGGACLFMCVFLGEGLCVCVCMCVCERMWEE